MELYYRKYGAGHPLIIVHGLYGSSDNWVSMGKELSEMFEVWLVDQRNHGQSPHSDEHNYKLLSDDLYGFMENHRIDKAILLGHSMGGKTVMQFAVDHPERISRLIVADIGPKTYELPRNENSPSLDHLDIIESMRSVDFDKVNRREDVDDHLSKTIKIKQIRQFLLKNLNRGRDGSFSWSINIEAIHQNIDQIMAGFNLDDFEDGRGITGFPVMFLRGENSDYISEEDEEDITTIFPYAEIVTIFDAGHWMHAEQPDAVLHAINNFVFG